MSKALHVPYKEPLEQNLWITTVDPEDKIRTEKLHRRFRSKGVRHFMQFFRDWSDEDPEEYIRRNLNEQGPQEQHINNIISFLATFVDSPTPYNLGVNCFAGVSRSTAVGIIAWVMEGKSPMEALRSILDVRPEAWPNLRMLRFATGRLGIDIVSPIQKWKSEQTNIYDGQSKLN
jgi:predicted protein tyrosine phosphatase